MLSSEFQLFDGDRFRHSSYNLRQIKLHKINTDNVPMRELPDGKKVK